MNLLFDSVPEFTQACCRLLRETDLHGVSAADWMTAAANNKTNDIFIQAWLEALPTWTNPTQPVAAIDAQAPHILAIGQAHHALLAEVVNSLVAGLHGSQLLARIQPHFPGLDLVARVPQVRSAEQAYQEASSKHLDWMIRNLGRPKDTADTEEDEVPDPVKPPHIIDPTASPDLRAHALIYQLLPVLKEDRPTDLLLLGYWHLWDQSDPMARYIDDYCRYDAPENIPALIAIQHQVVNRGLETKLALLCVTLSGIVTRQLNQARTALAAHFDGDMPGIDIARFVSDPKTGDASNTLRLTSWLGNDQWQIGCAGTSVIISEATAQALLVALDKLFDVNTALLTRLNADFETALNHLVALDDREFQGFLREMQSATLELMLSGLPDTKPAPPDFDRIHPFYRKVERNMSERAWEMLAYDVEQQGRAPLNVFELAEILGVLTKVRPALLQGKKTKSLLGKLKGGDSPSPPYPLELPDIVIATELTLAERSPRQSTWVTGETRWQINLDEMRLLGCQLKHRGLLQADKADFDAAWASEWLQDLKNTHPVRRQRVLRHLSRAEAALLTDQPQQEERWPEIAQLILAHPMFAMYPVY
ncbi:hypothetical protein MASR1M60_09450 [Rhodocyclaceae bacterium]